MCLAENRFLTGSRICNGHTPAEPSSGSHFQVSTPVDGFGYCSKTVILLIIGGRPAAGLPV
jgi:hypothetical protein